MNLISKIILIVCAAFSGFIILGAFAATSGTTWIVYSFAALGTVLGALFGYVYVNF